MMNLTHLEAEAFTQTTTHDPSELVGETVTALPNERRVRFIVDLVTKLEGGRVYLAGTRLTMGGAVTSRRAGAWLDEVLTID